MLGISIYKYDVIANFYDAKFFSYRMFYESTPEFEEIRDLCLSENNWLSENYTRSNLKIENHKGYCLVIDDRNNEPVIMGGVFNDGRYPNYVARILNRLYVFPKYRTNIRTIADGCSMVHQKLVLPLIEENDFDLYFATMQNRDKPTKGWWRVWKNSMQKGSDNFWTEREGYIQGCPWNVQKCWQNFVYHEMEPGSFERWNPTIIDHDTWLRLEKGI